MERPVKEVKGCTSKEIKALIDDPKPFVVGICLQADYQVSLGHHPSGEVTHGIQVSFK